MKTRLLFTLALLFAMSFSHAQKITGYLPSYRTVTPGTNIQYDKLTDIVFAFINPNLAGNLITYNLNPSSAVFDFEMSKFLEVKAHCKTYGVRLHIAVGGADAGGLRDGRLAAVCGASGTRGILVSDLVSFAITHELAGIDIDWEFPDNTTERASHESLLSELRTAINNSSRKDLLLSVAVGGEFSPTSSPAHTDYINSTAVGYADIFYIMAYDLPSAYGTNHSDRTASNNSMNAWNTLKSVPKAKMQLGVPFYGRNAGRSLIQEYGTLAAAAPATVFGADSYTYSGNTYYYNGGATLQGKTTDVMTTQCGQGIMIWDLGEDRVDANSLLGAINTRMGTECNYSVSLGADKTLCGGSVTLDCGLTAAGKTFSWTRDGVAMSGVTTPSTSVTQGGTYKITVKVGCCTKTDEVYVLEGAAATANGVTRCGSGSVTLNTTSGAGTYNWYSGATTGTKLATGTSYSPNITATTTYYLQRDYGTKVYTGARQYNSPTSCWADRWQDEDNTANAQPEWAQKITTYTDVTIQSVKFWYPNVAVNGVSLKIYAADGFTLVNSTTPFNIAVNNNASTSAPLVYTLPVNISLPPGNYFLGIHAPVTFLGIYMLHNGAGPFSATSVTDVFTIEANGYRNFGFGFTGATTNYGTLFDWKISAPIVSACGRTPVVATVNCTPVVTLTSPAPPGPVTQTVNTALSLSANATDDGTIASMSYVIKKVSDGSTVATITGGAGPNYTATWTPTSSDDYTVTAVATDNGSLTGSSSTVTVTVAPLPVEFISFTGKNIEEGNLLKWSTASETNNSHFEVEHSTTGDAFRSIGRVEGSGSFVGVSNYSFTDKNYSTGYNFYRLAQYDIDGKVNRTSIITIQNEGTPFCSVQPNPFNDETILFLGNIQQAKVELIDVQGNSISFYNVDEVSSELSVGAGLPAGVYQLRVIAVNYSRVFKIVKL